MDDAPNFPFPKIHPGNPGQREEDAQKRLEFGPSFDDVYNKAINLAIVFLLSAEAPGLLGVSIVNAYVINSQQ